MNYILYTPSGKEYRFTAKDRAAAIKMVEEMGESVTGLSELKDGAPPTPEPTLRESFDAAAAKLKDIFKDKKAPTVTPPAGVGIGAGAGVGIGAEPTIREEFDVAAAELAATFTDSTRAERDDYRLYLEYLKTEEGANWPVPKDIGDFLSNLEGWAEDVGRGYTEEQLREFNTWRRYASKFGQLTDWYPTNLEDWLANYDFAQQQLAIWQQQATQQEQEQLEREGEIEEAEEHALDPAEAARRREESYREGRVAAGERYRDQPSYQEPFAAWMSQQGGMSGAFRGFVESEYPSLKSEYQAGLGALTGYPTPTAARAEAAKREAGFKAWLPKQIPGEYQEYMSQRPWERGVRYATQSPSLRGVNW